jgi:hypothetical protein
LQNLLLRHTRNRYFSLHNSFRRLTRQDICTVPEFLRERTVFMTIIRCPTVLPPRISEKIPTAVFLMRRGLLSVRHISRFCRRQRIIRKSAFRC